MFPKLYHIEPMGAKSLIKGIIIQAIKKRQEWIDTRMSQIVDLNTLLAELDNPNTKKSLQDILKEAQIISFK